MEVGEIPPEETLRFWSHGEWREIQLRQLEITDDHSWDYSPEIQRLLIEGAHNLEEGNLKQAERLFRRVLKLDSAIKEAYHNLGVLYGRQGDGARATEMCEAALEIDPLYVHPRCNLALQLLDEGDWEGAREMLHPLGDLTRFHPQEMAFYSYVQARLAMEEREYELARNSLEMALEVWPGYELAEQLLSRLELVSQVKDSFDDYFERQRKRDQAKRRQLQAALMVPDPSLREALPLYTKEALTGMGRVVLPWGGWSSLRKAELLDELVDGLSRVDNLERITDELTDGEREALKWVLDRGGHLPWQEFDARVGNDLEESRYWQWHVPQTIMGRLRHRGLLVETTVEGELLVAVPLELQPLLADLLGR
jgi:tetratricopeptide (TPR) repeat protein